MDEELLVLRTDWKADHDGTLLTACLLAHFALERAHARAELAVRLWLALSAVVWLAALSPRFPPSPWREPVLAAWLALAASALGFSLCGRYWKKKLEARAARLEPGEAPRLR